MTCCGGSRDGRWKTAAPWGRSTRTAALSRSTRGERPTPPNLVSLAFARVIRREGLPKITLHGLRHTFATIASAQGAPLFDIGKALGHSTPATTGKIYTHLLDHTHASTLAKVAAAMEDVS